MGATRATFFSIFTFFATPKSKKRKTIASNMIKCIAFESINRKVKVGKVELESNIGEKKRD